MIINEHIVMNALLATFDLGAASVRHDYRLRGAHLTEIRGALELHFRRVPRTALRAGDVMLLSAGEQQAHLAVRTERGFVHAHAGLRRVVETPGMPEWPLLAIYRIRSRSR